ncbi:hypothetical protein NPIL_584421 [Nephila pilipes]|uniref:Uncharacterized protein n=1 Tax=Nephila pilipes TaxID=299642 RepID=A0A8X6SYI7_NEPPI|nr:hypothetical protein NPIL_584421 [Nephila pilipes]
MTKDTSILFHQFVHVGNDKFSVIFGGLWLQEFALRGVKFPNVFRLKDISGVVISRSSTGNICPPLDGLGAGVICTICSTVGEELSLRSARNVSPRESCNLKTSNPSRGSARPILHDPIGLAQTPRPLPNGPHFCYRSAPRVTLPPHRETTCRGTQYYARARDDSCENGKSVAYPSN